MSNVLTYEEAVAAQRRPPRENGGGPLDLRELVRLGTLAASSHNTQPWKFRLGHNAMTILPDFAKRCPVVDPDDSHLFKSLGCAAENITHAAAAQGQVAEPRFDVLTQAIKISFEPSRTVKPGPLARAIPVRQCTKLPYDGRPLAADETAALATAGMGEGVRTIMLHDEQTRAKIIELVREGNLIQLGDPAFRRELISWLRFNDAAALRTGDGLSGKTAGQPQLPDWIARPVIRFVLSGKSQARTDEANIRSSPLIAVFTAVRDDAEAWVETGRVYQRFALQAAALGLRTAFINQPIEVRPLRQRLNGLLGLKDEQALLMLRVGHGPIAPYSLRRPVEDVIIPA